MFPVLQSLIVQTKDVRSELFNMLFSNQTFLNCYNCLTTTSLVLVIRTTLLVNG
jgi:hypothetical protein